VPGQCSRADLAKKSLDRPKARHNPVIMRVSLSFL
jgi:hypothetical protein